MTGNPYHVPAGSPEGGQFTFAPGGEGAIIESARIAAGLPESSERREETYRQFWDESQELAKARGAEVLPYERAWMVGPDGEKINDVGEAVGSGFSMSFTQFEISHMRGNTLIHNHPVDVSFSAKDLSFGARFALSGVVVAENFGIHILDYNIPDTGMRNDIALDLMNTHEMLFNETFSSYQATRENWTISQVGIKPTYHKHSVEVMEALDVHPLVGEYIDYQYIPWE